MYTGIYQCLKMRELNVKLLKNQTNYYFDTSKWFFFVSVNDADFKAGVTSLSMILQIPPHTDHLEQLKVRRRMKFS